MYTIKKILVPTDFSEAAARAYSFAQTIAQKCDSVIDVLHVIPAMEYFNESMAKMGVPFNLEKDIYPPVQRDSLHKINKIMDDYFKEEQKGKAQVEVDSKPSKAIAAYAKEHGYDLIVMGSRGAHETNLLRGSITEKVIRYSEVPLLAVNRQTSADGLKRLMVPTDGSELSLTSFGMAVTFAKIYDADITLFHVIALHESGMKNLNTDPRKSEEQNAYEALLKKLESYLDKHDNGSVQIRRGDKNFEDSLVVQDGASSYTFTLKTEVRKGISAHEGIEDYAQEQSDLVVMATHGHRGLARFFLGSTTEWVAQHLDKPILTVKPAEDELK